MKSVICRLLCVGLAVMAVPTASQAYCVDYSQSLRLVGTARLSDNWAVGELAAISPAVYAQGALSHDIAVMDFTDPAHVVELSRLTAPGGVTGVWAGAQTVIMRYSGGGLVVDASNPLVPVVTDTLPVSLVGSILDVFIVGDLAYLATDSQGLLLLDVSVPTAAQVLGTWNPGRSITNVAVFGTRAYAATGIQVDIVEITDPAHPVQVDSLAVAARLLDVQYQTLAVVDVLNDVSLYDTSLYSPPALVSRFRSGDNILGIDLFARPDYSTELVVCSSQKTEFFSIRWPFDVTREGEVWDMDSRTTRSNVVNGLVVINGWEMGIFDLGLGHVASFRDHMPVPGYQAVSLAASGHTVYVGAGISGLAVYEVGRSQNPVLVGTLPDRAYSVRVQGSQVVALGSDGLHVIDATDPTLPVTLGTLNIGGADMALDRHRVWLTNGYKLVQGVDISDPSHPLLATSFTRPMGTVRGLDAGQGFLHIVDYDGTYEIYSTATEPPLLVATVATGENLYDVTLDGDVAILSSFMGLSFYQVSDPGAPRLLSEFPVYLGAGGVSVQGNRAAVELFLPGGVLLMDIADPTQPRATGTVWGRARTPTILDTGDIVAVYSYYTTSMQDELGWVPADCQMAAPVALPSGYVAGTLAAFPNPFNPRTVLSFGLPAAGPCRLTIHDLSGRLVRVLCDENRAAGVQEFVWQGRDDRGRSVPSGVYLAQMVSAAGRSVRKLALIR